MLNATWLRLIVLPLRVVPALLLVIFAGVVGLVALFCPSDRRDYALDLVSTWTTAACIIALGQSKVALPTGSSNQKLKPGRGRSLATK
ncbi:hypothetical protein ACWEIJ_10540 [Lentzea sp. NPDC004789]